MKLLLTLFAILSVVGSICAVLPIVPCDKNPYNLKIDAINVFNATWTCDKEPCVVYGGLNLSITISFENTGPNTIDKLENDVYGIFDHITVPYPKFPADQKEVCSLGDTSSSCPIKSGDKFTEKVTLPVINAPVHNKQVVGKWELNNGDTKEGCFQVLLLLA